MESRILVFLLKAAVALLGLTMLGGCASTPDAPVNTDPALPVIQPEVDRREVSEADIDTENFEIGAYLGYMSVEDFGTNFVYGARLAYHLSEKFFVEGTYGTTDTDETSFEKLSGGAPLLSDDDREFTYYDISVGYNLLPGEVFVGSDLAMNSALYVLGGVGNTDFADDNYFTVVLGAGFRVLPTDSIAVHFAVRDHMFDSDLLGDSKVTHNIEFNLGLTYFF
jgi:outer membrane beta-barrel protein